MRPRCNPGVVVLGVAVLFGASTTGEADGFVAVLGGATIPVGDHTWRSEIEPSPKLGLRLAAFAGDFGGMLSVDASSLREDTSYPKFGCGSFNSSSNIVGRQFRLLAHLVWERPVFQSAALDLRAGAGLDHHHLSFDYDFMGAFPEHGTYDESDTGFAVEAGAGLWFALGPVSAGGELAVPISFHRPANTYMNPFAYTAYSIDVLLGIRIGSVRHSPIQ